MNKKPLDDDFRTYYALLRGTTVRITRLERLVTRCAIAVLALTLLLVVLKV